MYKNTWNGKNGSCTCWENNENEIMEPWKRVQKFTLYMYLNEINKNHPKISPHSNASNSIDWNKVNAIKWNGIVQCTDALQMAN